MLRAATAKPSIVLFCGPLKLMGQLLHQGTGFCPQAVAGCLLADRHCRTYQKKIVFDCRKHV